MNTRWTASSRTTSVSRWHPRSSARPSSPAVDTTGPETLPQHGAPGLPRDWTGDGRPHRLRLVELRAGEEAACPTLAPMRRWSPGRPRSRPCSFTEWASTVPLCSGLFIGRSKNGGSRGRGLFAQRDLERGLEILFGGRLISSRDAAALAQRGEAQYVAQLGYRDDCDRVDGLHRVQRLQGHRRYTKLDGLPSGERLSSLPIIIFTHLLSTDADVFAGSTDHRVPTATYLSPRREPAKWEYLEFLSRCGLLST